MSHYSKEIKKELAGKIESVLPEIKKQLGEKKFNKRIKKAAKLFAHGLHDTNQLAPDSKPKSTNAIMPKAPKKTTAKKAKAKA